MVGFKKHDSMTQSEKFVAGVVSGITTRFVTQPMDVIKIRAQLLKKPKQKSVVYRIARRIWWEEGIHAFWHGHALGQMHSILAVTSQFYFYELATQQFAKLNIIHKDYRSVTNFVSGIFAGVVSTTLVIPLEVIRVRQVIVKDQYRSLIKAAQAVHRYGGIKAFYEGWTAAVLQMGPQVGISFAVFSALQPLILKLFFDVCPSNECKLGNQYKPQNVMLASSTAGCIAGFISKSLTYPFDLAKRRLQIGTHRANITKYKVPSQTRDLIKCKKLSQCLLIAYKKEGFKGLFRGWTVTVYKAQLTSVVAYTTYEMVCYFIREWN